MPNGRDLERWLHAGEVGAAALAAGRAMCREGTRALDVVGAMEACIRDAGLEPAFPPTVSVNSIAAHWTPPANDETVLRRGDVVKVDCGASDAGALSDNACTVEVGTNAHTALIATARACLEAAFAMVRPGLNLGELGARVEQVATGAGFRPIDNLAGHSLETYRLHAGLSVPSVATRTGQTLKAGDILAIEPFLTDGTAGRIVNAGPGNIYLIARPAPQRQDTLRRVQSAIQARHPRLAFASRWLANEVPPSKLAFALSQLERQGVLTHYPALGEASGGLVAQFEATVLVTEDGGKRMTPALAD